MEHSLSQLLLTDEQYDTITKLSAAGYSFKDISLFLGIKYSVFKDVIKDKSSKLYECYYKGQLLVKAKIDLALSEDAIAGGVTAIQIQMKRKEETDFNNIKSQVWDI